MRNFIAALFAPIQPPKNYSFTDRNFEQEYNEMKAAYQSKQQQKHKFDSLRSEKFEYKYAR